MIVKLLALIGDEDGKAPVKLVLGSCLLGVAVASSSPAFQANPLIGNTVFELHKHLPDTLDKITRAMGG